MNLAEALHEWAEKCPDKPALIKGRGGAERVMTYQELSLSVQSTALQLREVGLGKESRAVLMQPAGIDLYIILLACFSCGITAIIIDPAVKKEVISYACKEIKPDAFIGSAKAHLLRLKYVEFRKIKITFHTSGYAPFSHFLSLRSRDSMSTPLDLPPEHPALITFTSGSTGMPKIACRTHEFLINQHRALSASLDHRESDIDLVTLPIFGLANLASGITSVIANTNLKFPAQADSEAILEQCRRYSVTRCAASPAFFKKLYKDGRFPAFQTIYTGGAPVFPSFLQDLSESYTNLEIVTVYGSTEAEPISHQRFSDLAPNQKNAQYTGEGLLVGQPVPDIKVKIDGDPVGEILVTGDHVLKEYLNIEKNAETKVVIEGEIWHRTGDLGRLDDIGSLWLLGRTSASFISKEGLAVYPFAIETAVMNIKGIEACAVIQHSEQSILCYAGTTDPETLKIATSPLGIEVWLQLPKIPFDNRHNAKIDYPELRKNLPSGIGA